MAEVNQTTIIKGVVMPDYATLYFRDSEAGKPGGVATTIVDDAPESATYGERVIAQAPSSLAPVVPLTEEQKQLAYSERTMPIYVAFGKELDSAEGIFACTDKDKHIPLNMLPSLVNTRVLAEQRTVVPINANADYVGAANGTSVLTIQDYIDAVIREG